jgi:ATP-dependent protease HslVU (ClpYQ) ATPase subunit
MKKNSKEQVRPLLTKLRKDSQIPPKRILIIGTTCTGKSTLAQKLSKILSIPHTELDALLAVLCRSLF